jgi:hypothetical protein
MGRPPNARADSHYGFCNNCGSMWITIDCIHECQSPSHVPFNPYKKTIFFSFFNYFDVDPCRTHFLCCSCLLYSHSFRCPEAYHCSSRCSSRCCSPTTFDSRIRWNGNRWCSTVQYGFDCTKFGSSRSRYENETHRLTLSDDVDTAAPSNSLEIRVSEVCEGKYPLKDHVEEFLLVLKSLETALADAYDNSGGLRKSLNQEEFVVAENLLALKQSVQDEIETIMWALDNLDTKEGVINIAVSIELIRRKSLESTRVNTRYSRRSKNAEIKRLVGVLGHLCETCLFDSDWVEATMAPAKTPDSAGNGQFSLKTATAATILAVAVPALMS